ncbi:MAG TPA: DUF3037 domain-containing protein, partial [Gemmatimonadaceae bacterium]|nr:DUF3037 domain-containing protein [Gemmatimonadaceae bacterium]
MKQRVKDSTTNASRPSDWISYNFAVLRVVPHVHVGAFAPVGIVLHARTSEYLGVRVVTDSGELRARFGDGDVEVLAQYLQSVRAIGEGDMAAGPIALSPPSERFHWLTAPRSDVIQSGPVHEGLCEKPEAELDRLYREIVHSPG